MPARQPSGLGALLLELGGLTGDRGMRDAAVPEVDHGLIGALQTAALRPPALKAIITVCSTDDRYADDIHYMGGALLNDNLWWGSIMLAYQARPPDPALRDDWRQIWFARLDAMPFWPALWQLARGDDWNRLRELGREIDPRTAPVLTVLLLASAYTVVGDAAAAEQVLCEAATARPDQRVPGPYVAETFEVKVEDEYVVLHA